MKRGALVTRALEIQVVFPGEIAGASLKQGGERPREPEEDPFSPAKSPGPH